MISLYEDFLDIGYVSNFYTINNKVIEINTRYIIRQFILQKEFLRRIPFNLEF